MPRFGPPLAMVLALGAVLGCRSTASESRKLGEPEPFVPLPDEGPQPIGYFLARFDRSLADWSRLELTAASQRDRSTLLALETSMRERAVERRGELLETLEAGAPVNRRVAAAALGFTDDPTVLGPLLAVLGEDDAELVQKALLGIGVLGVPDTPTAQLRSTLVHAQDAWTRNNAAFALLSVVRAGGRGPELAEACRTGLVDPEPGVRAQCASALGALADPEAVPALRELLADGHDLTAMAATFALANIGRENAREKGAAARALATSLDTVSSTRREHVLRALRWLANRDLGSETEEWLEWAHRLP